MKKPKIKRTLTRVELANMLGLHAGSIKQHHQRSNPPPFDEAGGRYFYNVGEYLAWMKSENLTGDPGRPTESSPELDAARLRKELAIVHRYERELAIADGTLVYIPDVARWINRTFGTAKHRLLAMPATLGPRMEGLDVNERKQAIAAYIEDILEQIGEYKPGTET